MAKPTGTRDDKTPSPSAAALPPAAAGKSNSSQAPKAPEPPKATQAPRRQAAPTPRAAVKASNQGVQTDGERRRRIAEAAYYRAERRGFAPGGEHDDWLGAEQEVDRGTPTDLPLEDNEFPSPK